MPGRKFTPEERLAAFWQKVCKDGPIIKPELGPCWMWMAYRDKRGYGLFGAETGKCARAARWIFEKTYGPLGKLFALHKCDNPPCVRPDHLESGDNDKNMADCDTRGRRRYGQHHWNNKLSREEVEAIRQASGLHKDIAANFGVCRSMVSSIKRGDRRSKG